MPRYIPVPVPVAVGETNGGDESATSDGFNLLDTPTWLVLLVVAGCAVLAGSLAESHKPKQPVAARKVPFEH